MEPQSPALGINLAIDQSTKVLLETRLVVI